MDNMTIVVSKMDNIPVIGFTLPSDIKMKLFLSGCQEAKQENTKESIYVKNYDKNDMTKFLLTLDIDVVKYKGPGRSFELFLKARQYTIA